MEGTKTLLTAEDLWQMGEEGRYCELVRGELIEKILLACRFILKILVHSTYGPMTAMPPTHSTDHPLPGISHRFRRR